MSVVFLYAIAAVAGFAIGWIVRARREDRRFRASEKRWQALADSLQGQLALERLRVESYARSTLPQGDPAPMFEFGPHLAPRPARSTDSSTVRA